MRVVDPSTEKGAKLLRAMTRESASDDDRIKVSIATAPEVHSHFKEQAARYSWGKMVFQVTKKYRHDSDTGTFSAVRGSLFTDPGISLRMVQLEASILLGHNHRPTNEQAAASFVVPDVLEARELTGRVRATYLRGRCIFERRPDEDEIER